MRRLKHAPEPLEPTQEELREEHMLEQGTFERSYGFLLVIGSTVFVLLVVSYGIWDNGGGKYVRLRSEECDTRWTLVGGATPTYRRTICCPESGGPLVCSAARSPVTPWLTSLAGAMLLPFAGFAVSVFWQLCTLSASHRQRARGRWLFRLKLYATNIALRTYVLYLGLNALQRKLQPPESDRCWYAAHRHHGKCSENFDFADHLVLALSQLLAPQVVEAYAIGVEMRHNAGKYPALAVTAAVAFCCLVTAHNTTAHFHTRAESIVALILVFFFTFMPLCLLLCCSRGRAFVAESLLS